ncbi:MAG: bifunctional GTP diphosphokinase/guanosine-3',5'-bis(diphosphate) 3'-diphosphatase [Coxiella sp. RIFCSPHIGHO2_12_FULL_42_15]|nr:MAG: bifunctional GTP diphosphokinase/guanosine-3',5'-bis(diphosphate) 3'-diphosphatase [Coxiella sp. RIFCSPHIGHO2_12_FULL_42_15]
MRLFKKLRRKLDYLDSENIERIHEAYLFAMSAHKGQKRRTGEAYITHPTAVAGILADMKLDPATIMAALLHDVIEDTGVTKAALEEKFGSSIAELVDGVSKLTQIEFISRAEAQAENFRKMVMAMAKDIRVIIVKLADRLHNMRTLGSLHALKRRRIATETLDIFAPIAKRLGMRELSVELEELGFEAQYPIRYKVLKDSVRKARGNRKRILTIIESSLHNALSNSKLISYLITGREKHLYSIYRKMRHKHIPFNEIMDVYAFRIIVDNADDCYRALGLVHSVYKPVPERFKDYIAIPKANGYQSLHTTLFGPYGLPVEVQIRTAEMNEMATSGIAAHWLYKVDDADVRRSQLRAQEWVRNLLELQQSAGNPLEFIESVKVDLFPDEVYVFTPRGDIMELPAGATAVDFAYAVHTDIGNSCVTVKIDRQLAPLSTRLTNGQTVEVITSAAGRPNPAWLDFIRTSKARNGIRHFLKSQRRAESVQLGRQLLKKALSEYSILLKKIPPEVIEHVVKETELKTFEDLLEEIGLGNRAAVLVAGRMYALVQEKSDIEPMEVSHSPLVIKGTEGMVVHYAACCCPIPGDPIVGVMDMGRGILVHVDDCPRIAKVRRHRDRYLLLRWSSHAEGEFLVGINVQVVNKRGVLAVLSLAISDADANIEDISVREKDGQHYLVNFKILVTGRVHLARVIRNLRLVRWVTKVRRA